MKKYRKILLIGTVLLWLILITSVLVLNSNNKSKYEEIAYNEFIKLIDEDKVEEVQINFSSETFTFRDTEGKEYLTDNPKSIDFKKFLLENDVKVSVTKISTALIVFEIFFGLLRIIVIIFVFKFVMGKMGMKLFEKKETLVTDIPSISFTDIAGNNESKEDMQFLVNFLKSPEKYHEMGAKLPKGVVLYGPPGTGKTLTAKAIAGEAGVPFFSASGSDFVEMYVGLGAKRVRDLFKEAREKAPCIVFIDEIDAVGTHRNSNSSNSEKDQTINALLAELDGFSSKVPIIVMIATNRVEDLDSALIRPGRFDRHIAINLPDNKDRLEILSLYTKNKAIGDDVNIEELAKITIGFSGAGLETLLNESAILAVNRGSKVIEKVDIDDAYFKMVMRGHKKGNKDEVDKNEVELVAYHEAGHALCAKLLTNNSVPKVTIIPSTSGAGGVTFNIPNKMGLLSKRDLLNNIKVLYAGRASEFILKGNIYDITTGASEDIKRATSYIKKYFNDYGMSERFGLLNLSEFEKDNSLVIEEAMKLSNELYQETIAFLRNHINALDAIANELIKKETLNEDDLDLIIKNHC